MGAFHLVEIFAINEWKLKRSILNQLKYKKIKLLLLSTETFFLYNVPKAANTRSN